MSSGFALSELNVFSELDKLMEQEHIRQWCKAHPLPPLPPDENEAIEGMPPLPSNSECNACTCRPLPPNTPCTKECATQCARALPPIRYHQFWCPLSVKNRARPVTPQQAPRKRLCPDTQLTSKKRLCLDTPITQML